jgi:hypothetical protein
MPALLIKVLVPLRMYPPALFAALVFIEPASEPASGSVMANAAIRFPFATPLK